jgi:hypothetical protein
VIALFYVAAEITRSAIEEVGYDFVLMGLKGIFFLIILDILYLCSSHLPFLTSGIEGRTMPGSSKITIWLEYYKSYS